MFSQLAISSESLPYFFSYLQPYRMQYLYFSLLLTCSALSLGAQTIYVDADAGGANDGSSWTDAYTDLGVAIDNAAAGAALWIADGTYIPGDGASDTLYYTIDKALELYGGFAGTETSPADRDAANAPTVVSGDASGDDTTGDFDANKADNLRKLFVVDSFVTRVTFDRLTLSGADAETDPDAFPTFWTRGAAIYARSPVTVNDCTFSGNRADRGAGVYVFRDGAGSRFTNSTFTQSAATNRCIGVYAFAVDDIRVSDCAFVDNPASLRGGVHFFRSNNSVVENCTFDNNISAGFNAGFYSWNGIDVRVRNCSFTNMSSTNATSIYVDGRENDTLNLTVTNCLFEGNNSTGRAGGLTSANGRVRIVGSAFNENTSTGSGGAINSSQQAYLDIDSCSFTRNESLNNWAGAIASYCDSIRITNSRFTRNACANHGGAINAAFQNKLTLIDCEFTENNATLGGAVNTQNDTTSLFVTNSLFARNIAASSGGGLNIREGATVRIDGSTIRENIAAVGAGINVSADSALIDDIRITNTFITENLADNQGGALSVANVNDLVLENVVATLNLADGDGIGGFLSNNANSNSVSSVILRNVTVSDNAGTAAIMQWEETDSATATLTLLNSLVISPTDNYAIELGSPEVFSLGGNVVSDATLGDLLPMASDQTVDGTNVFANPNDQDYSLAAGSAAIDAGVDDGSLPALDIAGNPRVLGDAVDAGAYEVNPVGIYDPALAELFALSPNPTPDVVRVTLDATPGTAAELRVYDAHRRLVLRRAVTGRAVHQLDLSALPGGTYTVLLQLGDRYAGRSVIKQ